MRRLGVIGSMVWDEIHGRDLLSAPVEEWGGIAYALSALDAALPDDWEIVPLIKVGRDLAPQANDFLKSLQRVRSESRFIEVPTRNQRVVLRYDGAGRRSEQMSGGVPSWTWEELGPLVHDLDALYINFIAGHELTPGTADALRHAFTGPIYADLHSLALGTETDGTRVLQALPDVPVWFSSFDMIQCNEDEFRQIGPSPLENVVLAMGGGASLVNVTLGAAGVVYFARPGFDGLGPALEFPPPGGAAAIRTEQIAPPIVDALDPTGCGDVFGGTCCARLLAGDDLSTALAAANHAAARNATFRGAGRLSDFLRGNLVLA